MPIRAVLLILSVSVFGLIAHESENRVAAQCEKISDNPLAPCKEVTDIHLERVSFDVVVEQLHCVPYLTYHGSFSELTNAVAAGKVGYVLYHLAHLPDGSIYKHQSLDSHYPHDEITETEILSRYKPQRKADLVKDFAGFGLIEPSDYREFSLLTAGNIQRSLHIRVYQDDFSYAVESNLIPNAAELADVDSQFVQCVRELDRIAEAAENAQVLAKAQQAANVQKQIAEADVAFYSAEIEKIAEATSQLETTLASATASYQEALNRQRDLVKLQQRHAQIMDQFFADKEQAYIKFQVWADDRFAAIQTHTENIERSRAEIQALIDEFETLRQETQANLDAALTEIEATPTSASGS